MLDHGNQVTVFRHDIFASVRKNVLLFSNLQQISLRKEVEAGDYFEAEFEKERLEFLSDQLTCSKETAVWAAKVFYHSAQLYLIREKYRKKY